MVRLGFVASLVDAWIETPSVPEGQQHRHVASLVDAWIETISVGRTYTYHLVASFVDAWIETFLTSYVLVNKIIFKLLSLFLLRCYVSL